MKKRKKIKLLFSELPNISQKELLDELLQEQELKGSILEIAQEEVTRKRKKKPCPHCGGKNVYKRGKQKGVQMYRCNECKRWYSETTGTPLYDIKLKRKWQSYLRCMEEGKPIKKIASELGISIQTSFDWRHKILSSLEQYAPGDLTSEVECDELELPVNNKGSKNLERKPRKRGSDFKRNQGESEITTVQVLTAVERSGRKYLKAVESKRLSKEEIEKSLEGKLSGDVVLITDKHPSYKAFAKENRSIKHKTVKSGDHVDKNDKTVNLQKVNNVHSQIRKFLRPFNGVSSKYLQNYLNWYAYVDNIRMNKQTLLQWFLAILATDQAYDLFLLFKQNAVIIRT